MEGPSGNLTQPLSGFTGTSKTASGVYADGVLNSPHIALDSSSIIYSEKFGYCQKFSCDNRRLVGSINCARYGCSKLILGCVLPVNFKINSLDTIVTDRFGKNGAQHVCSPGFFLIGLECTGADCDDFRLICGAAYLEEGF